MGFLLTFILLFSLEEYYNKPEIVQTQDLLLQDTVIYKILPKEIRTSSGDIEVEISYKLINLSSYKFLLYSFIGLQDGVFADTSYMSIENVVGNVILIYQENEQIFPWFDISPDPEYDYTGMTFEKLVNVHNSEKQRIMNSKIALTSGDSVELTTKVSLKNFELEKGEYELCLLYYSGKNLNNFISEYERKVIENQSNAVTFSGWVRSNSIKLIVE